MMFAIMAGAPVTWDWKQDWSTDALGVIQLGGAIESMSLPTDYWSAEDYERSWRAALQRMVDGAAMDALVHSTLGNGLGGCWPMWRVGDDVAFRDVYMDREVGRHIDLRRYRDALYPYEPDREGSEWRVPLSEIKAFMAREVLVESNTAARAAEWQRVTERVQQTIAELR